MTAREEMKLKQCNTKIKNSKFLILAKYCWYDLTKTCFFYSSSTSTGGKKYKYVYTFGDICNVSCLYSNSILCLNIHINLQIVTTHYTVNQQQMWIVALCCTWSPAPVASL